MTKVARQVRVTRVAPSTFTRRESSSTTSSRSYSVKTRAHKNLQHSSRRRMALKRKRSSVTISSPASITSDATAQSVSPPPFSFPHHSQPYQSYHEPTWSFPKYDDDQNRHLNSRTQKRYRNNRPDEQSVYGVSPLAQCRRDHELAC